MSSKAGTAASAGPLNGPGSPAKPQGQSSRKAVVPVALVLDPGGQAVLPMYCQAVLQSVTGAFTPFVNYIADLTLPVQQNTAISALQHSGQLAPHIPQVQKDPSD